MKKKLFALILLLAAGLPLLAQVRIGGTVSDNVGPMVGASVVEMGTTNGTVTGSDGSFTLTVKPGATIVVSSIGYKDREIAIGNQTRFAIVMEEDNEMIEETVVIGYGVQRKSDVTGAIASVGSEVLENRSVDNVAAAFAGKTSGVQVISSSGDPSSIGTIRIRGISSNNSGASNPLYIVDGLQVSSLSTVDPQNVKSIEILKDAASAAIYGAQAGNGVVVITTKTGEKGDGRFFYNGSYTIQKLGYHPTTMNAQQYIDFMKTAGALSQGTLDDYWDGKTDTDWFDFLFPGGFAQRHTFGAQGANDKGRFYTSVSYLTNNGMVYGSRDVFNRLNFQLNADYQVKKWFKVGTTNTFQIRKTPTGSGRMSGAMTGAFTLDPLTPPLAYPGNMPRYMQDMLDNGYDVLTVPTGEYITTSMFNERTTNPLANIYSTTDGASENYNFNGTLYANLTPFKGFTFTSRLGYAFSVGEGWTYNEPYYINGVNQRTTYNLSDNINYTLRYQWENFINYTYTIAKKHKIDAMAGMSYIQSNSVNVDASTDKLTEYAPNFRYLDYSHADAVKGIGGTHSKTANMSYFGRLGYSYDNRYFLQVSFRADAFDTSKLSAKNRWGYFPSVSLGWTISNEPWMKGVSRDVLSFLKIRSSWGINGNINALSDYQWATTVKVGASNYQLWNDPEITNASYPTTLANADLKWETSKQYDAGLDARFLRDRLTVTLDAYLKDTDDLIVQVTPSYITGYDKTYVNAGSVRNKGIELELGWKDQVGDFGYGISGNISRNVNKVTYLDPTLTHINGVEIGNTHYATRFQKDYPVWAFFGTEYLGVNPENGDPIYKDQNGDEKMNDDDNVFLGSAQPAFTYGITLNAEWKGFDLTVFGSGSQGNKIWFAGIRPDYVGRNLPVQFYTDSWKNPGDNSRFPAPKHINTASFLKSTAVIFDGSYFRINQIQFGYNIPRRILGKVGLGSLRIYASLDDFFTFSNYLGFDPSVAGSDAGSGRGLDSGTYPTSKRIMFGLNLSF